MWKQDQWRSAKQVQQQKYIQQNIKKYMHTDYSIPEFTNYIGIIREIFGMLKDHLYLDGAFGRSGFEPRFASSVALVYLYANCMYRSAKVK